MAWVKSLDWNVLLVAAIALVCSLYLVRELIFAAFMFVVVKMLATFFKAAAWVIGLILEVFFD